MDFNNAIEDLKKLLSNTILLYEEVIRHDETLISEIDSSDVDVDCIDEYLDERDKYTDSLDKYSDECSSLLEQIRKFMPTEQTSNMSEINSLCQIVQDKANRLMLLDGQTKLAIQKLLNDRRQNLNISRKNAAKAQRYLSNINNVSQAADTIIDTSKKI